MYLNSATLEKTPTQRQPLDKRQVKNNAGGFVYEVDDFTQLGRWLILGSESGSYYAGERELTLENVRCLKRCVEADGVRTVNLIRDISVAGRAPKNDPALYALASCFKYGDVVTRTAAEHEFNRIVRIGTHLLHFVSFIDGMKGWNGDCGRSVKQAVEDWYDRPDTKQVAYQVVKYWNRDGWTHRDVFRLAHPKPHQDSQNAGLYHYIAKGWESVGPDPHPTVYLRQIWAAEKAKRSTSVDEIVGLIREYDLPRECIPTNFLTEVKVWGELLKNMPVTALIRNLATMTRNGTFKDTKKVDYAIQRFTDDERIRKGRAHPFQFLTAAYTYAGGRSLRGDAVWSPIKPIQEGLEKGFVKSFANLEPTGKRVLYGLDVSGSMNSGTICGVPGLTPRVGTAALAYLAKVVDPNTVTMAFSHQFQRFVVDPENESLLDVMKRMDATPFGRTDCAQPMVFAREHGIPVDAFVVLTDNETWFGAVHPMEALRRYREKTGIPAKLVVVGMVSNGFTIADPKDAGTLDLVGMDGAAPKIMEDFVRGDLFGGGGGRPAESLE